MTRRGFAECIRSKDTWAATEWVFGASIARTKARFDLAIRMDNATTRIASGTPAAREEYELGCIQDTLIAALIIELENQARISRADMIGYYLPELLEGTSPGSQISISNLLSHSSGLWITEGEWTAAAGSWQSISRLVKGRNLEFPPGHVVNYTLVERAILLRILSSILPGRISDPLVSTFAGFVSEDQVDHTATGSLTGRLTTLAEAFASPSGLIQECYDIVKSTRITMADIGKPWVPTAIANGSLRFANGTFGQNGLSKTGCLGVRAVPTKGIAVAGWFPSQIERDQVLARVIDDLAGFAVETDTRHIVGSLNGFEAENISGTYQGLLTQNLEVKAFPTSLMVKGLLGDSGRLRLERDDCGHLSLRIWSPNLWIEAFAHPINNKTCLRIGQNVFVRK